MYWFWERKKERIEKHWCESLISIYCLLQALYWGLSPKPSLESNQPPFCAQGQGPISWDTRARAISVFFKTYAFLELFSLDIFVGALLFLKKIEVEDTKIINVNFHYFCFSIFQHSWIKKILLWFRIPSF